MRDYSTMATDGGAGSKLWQGWSVIWTKWYSWIAKRNYRVTKYETSMKPQTKLDQRRNWGINLDLRTRWPETEKIRFDAPTQLYWKEGMPTLRMFFFSFRFFLKVVSTFFLLFFKSTKTKICFFAGNSSSPLNLAFRIFTYRRLGTSLFDETFWRKAWKKSIATALKIQTGWSLHLWITTRQKVFCYPYLFFNLLCVDIISIY